MGVVTSFLTGAIVQSTTLHNAVIAFESYWIEKFWIPSVVHTDSTFTKGEFCHMLCQHDIYIRPITPSRLQKALLETEHG